MADQPVDKGLLPTSLVQNPALVETPSQDRMNRVQEQTTRIVETFLQVLPSNYVSLVEGPFYTVQFKAAAQQVAEFQITAQEIWADRDYDFTRPEFLFQLVGSLVFPDAGSAGYPVIEGDLTFRTFLKRMVALLLQGATPTTVEEGLALLTDADIEVIERSLAARTTPGSAWGLDDQFTFEINVSGANGQAWPSGSPFTLAENIKLVMRALKPAHTLYDLRFLFKENFGTLFTDTVSWTWDSYYYEDLRKFCYGIKSMTGTGGRTLTDRSLFQDTARDFSSVSPGADLTILTGPNSISASLTDRTSYGRFRVADVLAFAVSDSTARSYTTSPTGLTGTATVTGDVVEDPSQNWGLAVEGELLTFSTGPNLGTYRLQTLLGTNGGPVGLGAGPATKVRVSRSMLRLTQRMRYIATGQGYEVAVDRLGVRTPLTVTSEDATEQFLL